MMQRAYALIALLFCTAVFLVNDSGEKQGNSWFTFARAVLDFLI